MRMGLERGISVPEYAATAWHVTFGRGAGLVFEESDRLVGVGQAGYNAGGSGPLASVGDPEFCSRPTHVPFGSGMPVYLW